jgi:branched-chain amino acid transport system ATP-binding protein
MAGLSSPERVAIRDLLEQLDPSIAVLLIEHDMDVAFSFAARITVLHQGRVLAHGSRDEVSANDLVQQAYLGGLRA